MLMYGFRRLGNRQHESLYWQRKVLNISSMFKVKQVWSDVRVSKWWQNFRIWVKYPFKTVLMCVTCKNISLFVDWLTELTAYSDSIVVFPLSFTFSSSVTIPHTVTATEEIRCNAGFTHYTIVHSAGDSDSGAQRATRKTKKDQPHTQSFTTPHTFTTHTKLRV